MPDDHDRDPFLILAGGTEELRLEEDGKVYRPGDRLPKSLSHARRLSLQAAGVRFATVHPEPVLTPDGAPATLAAAEQIDPPAGAPAVVAAVESRPADAPPAEGDPAPRAESPRRAARKDD